MSYPIKFKQSWYAVYTKPRLEKSVYNKIIDMGVESFLPTQNVIKIWSDRKKKVEEPLFPNYVFVKTSAQERFDLFAVPGLVRFIAQEGRPVEIPDQDIENIKCMLSSDGKLTCHSYSGKIGSKVLIKNGQFAGIEGVVQKQNGMKRLTIQIEALRQVVSVDIPSGNVELV